MRKEIMSSQKNYSWDALEYSKHSTAQQSWANELIKKLNLEGNEAVLDIGCGDGKITAQLSRSLSQGSIIGIDNSNEMIELAGQTFDLEHYPNLRFKITDARSIPFRDHFDIVFSNAALHWIWDHKPVLKAIHTCLKPGGHILLQMGGKGNADTILVVLKELTAKEKWKPFFKNHTFQYGFHDSNDYKKWLTKEGFTPQRVELIPKVMSYENNNGLAGWIRTTWLPYTNQIPKSERETFISQIVDTYLEHHPADKNGHIHVDMVRLEVEAKKK